MARGVKDQAPPLTPNERLIRAAVAGDIGGIRSAMADGASVEACNCNFFAGEFVARSALERACDAGQLAASHYLLDLGASPRGYQTGQPRMPDPPWPIIKADVKAKEGVEGFAELAERMREIIAKEEVEK